MLKDECDVIGCKSKATKEIEENGENWFVCDFHAIGKIELKGGLK